MTCETKFARIEAVCEAIDSKTREVLFLASVTNEHTIDATLYALSDILLDIYTNSPGTLERSIANQFMNDMADDCYELTITAQPVFQCVNAKFNIAVEQYANIRFQASI